MSLPVSLCKHTVCNERAFCVMIPYYQVLRFQMCKQLTGNSDVILANIRHGHL